MVVKYPKYAQITNCRVEKYIPENITACGNDKIPAPSVAVIKVNTLPFIDPFENFLPTNSIGHKIFIKEKK
jgi:hypothetical protein